VQWLQYVGGRRAVVHGDEFLTWNWHQRENAASQSLPLPLSLMTVLRKPALVSSQVKEEAAEKKKKGILSARHLGRMHDWQHEKDGRTLSVLAAASRADLLDSLFSFALRLQYIMSQSVLLQPAAEGVIDDRGKKSVPCRKICTPFLLLWQPVRVFVFVFVIVIIIVSVDWRLYALLSFTRYLRRQRGNLLLQRRLVGWILC
jgi:hypothetical protein